MKCPRCVQSIHRSAVQCPHCSFSLPDLDEVYGSREVGLERLSDVAGVLRLRERQKLVRSLDEFQLDFPQLFFSVYCGAMEDMTNIRQYGMWLLNHANFKDAHPSNTNDRGILLLVDMNTKVASLTFGYMLDPYLTEDETFHMLAKAHPHWLQGNHMKAVSMIAKQLSRVLRKKSKRCKKHPELFEHARNDANNEGNASVSNSAEQVCLDHASGARSSGRSGFAWLLGKGSRPSEFPVVEMPRRLGAKHAAGVGAMLSFHRKLGSPSRQRGGLNDYLTRV